MKVLLLLVSLPTTAFCAFGLLSTLEPMDDETALFWRFVYGSVGFLSSALSVWVFPRRSGSTEPE